MHGMTVRNQMVLQRGMDYKIRCRKGKWIRCLSIRLSFRLLQLIPISSVFVNCFHVTQGNTCPFRSYKVPDWLATGALSACYQRPFEVQSSTFSERLGNQLIYCRLKTCFLHVFFIFAEEPVRACVMVFQNLICILNVLKRKGFYIGG